MKRILLSLLISTTVNIIGIQLSLCVAKDNLETRINVSTYDKHNCANVRNVSAVDKVSVVEGFNYTPTSTGDAKAVSIAEFNAAEVNANVWYQLTGTVKNLKDNDQYGNFDLEDATSSVYVYGLLSERDGVKKQFQELVAAKDIANGSKITIIGTRGEFNGKIEVMNAYFVSIEGVSEQDGGSEQINGGEVSSNVISITFADLGLANQERPTTLTLSYGITLTFDGGVNTNAPTYYNTGTAMRMYPKNTMIINADYMKIEAIEIVCDEYNSTLYNASGDITANDTKMTIEGTSLKYIGPNANIVTIANTSETTGAASQLRMKTLKITSYDLISQKTHTIHVDSAGTLSKYILEDDKYRVEELTLSGELNGTDFQLLRDMAGNNSMGKETNGSLRGLNLADAKIVSGGSRYLDAEWITCSFGRIRGGQFEIKKDIIGEKLFAGCLSLQKVVLPKDVVIIDNSAFENNKNLASVIIGDKVTSLGNSCFDCCYQLQEISLPTSLKHIGESAFENCAQLTSIAIPNGITRIENKTFADCI